MSLQVEVLSVFSQGHKLRWYVLSFMVEAELDCTSLSTKLWGRPVFLQL